jgi:hypothetical protein
MDSAPEQARRRGGAEVSFRPSVPRVRMASTVAGSEWWARVRSHGGGGSSASAFPSQKPVPISRYMVAAPGAARG